MTFNEAKSELKHKYQTKQITSKEYMFELAQLVKKRNQVVAKLHPEKIFDGKLPIDFDCIQ